MSDSLNRYIAFFEQISPQRLDEIEQLFTADARFTDPFNQARGHRQIRAVFEHMFEHCQAPRFRVQEVMEQDRVAYLRWSFSFGTGTRRATIKGVSRIRLSASGRIEEHVDYWDAAGQLYARIPLLGAIIRALQRRLSATRKERPPARAQ